MTTSAPETTAEPRRVREIVLALETDGRDSPAIPLALSLARHFAAGLVALLVESEALRRAASLPFCVEVRRHSGDERRLDPALLERSLRQALQQLERSLMAPASGLRVDVRRVCSRPLQLLDEHATADIVVFGRSTVSRWLPAERSPIRLETAATDPAHFDEAARALQAHTASAPWERLHWTGDADVLARLRRRRPSLILISRRDIARADGLQQLIEALDEPIVVLP
ncbi:MAG: hypothetical protein AB1651_11980 [Pseudomonadota bacterium]